MSETIEPRTIETSEVVHLGSAPGEQYGFECAVCQEVSGLEFGNHDDAQRALNSHTRLHKAVAAIEAEGWTVQFEEFCENADTPGLLGQISGVTDRNRQLVRIATHNRSPEQLADTAEHELRHVQDPTWDCGNRDVFGRGGPA